MPPDKLAKRPVLLLNDRRKLTPQLRELPTASHLRHKLSEAQVSYSVLSHGRQPREKPRVAKRLLCTRAVQCSCFSSTTSNVFYSSCRTSFPFIDQLHH